MRVYLLLCTILLAGCGGSGRGEDAGSDDDAPEATDTAAEGEEGDQTEEVECTEDDDCEDGNPCTSDACDRDDGVCEHDPVDADGDGFVAEEIEGIVCGGTDCDDGDDAVNPDADPGCSEGDDLDCDAMPDRDEDGDGFIRDACTGGDDCDDGDPDAFPGSTMLSCDADMDCNDLPDSDNDGDGQASVDCGGADCDDGDPLVRAGIPEADCDGKDTNCDFEMSEEEDGDGDGHPNETCAPPGVEPDCDDSDDTIHPGTTEECDEVDDDCDGSWADGGADDDSDTVLDAVCGGDDCDDTRADTWPGAFEVCGDAIDQDCDTIADDPGASMADARITSDSHGSDLSDLVWSGSEYGVAWVDDRDGDAEIYFARISALGAKVGTDVRITADGTFSYAPSLAWSGSEHAIAWHAGTSGATEIHFARISASGSMVGSEVRLTDDPAASESPSLAWTGSEYGVAWSDGRDGYPDAPEIYFARISASGEKIGSDERISHGTRSSLYSLLAWTGSEFGVVWVDGRDWPSSNNDVYFTRISAAGLQIGTDVNVGVQTYSSSGPSLVWAGSQYGLSWITTSMTVNLAGLSYEGARIGSDLTIASGFAVVPGLGWTGSEYGVGWQSYMAGNVYLARVAPSGTLIGTEARITYRFSTWHMGALAWSGSEHGMTWTDNRDGNNEIYFNRVMICP